MAEQKVKGLILALFLSIITFTGYSAGLISAPSKAKPVAVHSAVLPIETAQNLSSNGSGPQENALSAGAFIRETPKNKTLAPYDAPEYIQTETPQGGANKIINIADMTRPDKRIVTLDNPLTYEKEGDAFPSGDDNPFAEPEIQVPDGGAFGVINRNGEKITLSGKQTPDNAEKANAKKKPVPPPPDPYAPRTPLIVAPVAGYTQKTANGAVLPFSPPGEKPLYRLYGGVTRPKSYTKSVAFILGGLGFDRITTERAIKYLPPEVTLGFIPYAPNLQKNIDLARQYGHEVILELPLEPYDYPRPDTGPDVLLTQQDEATYRKRLTVLLSKATGYAGVMNYLGGKYLANTEKTTRLLSDIKNFGLYFLENPTTRGSKTADLAPKTGVPFIKSEKIIDEIPSPAAVTNSLIRTLKNKPEDSPLIVTGYASSDTINAFIAGVKLAEENGLERVPAGVIAR